MNLYEINQEYRLLLDNLHDEFGQVNSSTLQLIENNELSLEKKVIQIASYMKNMEAERLAIIEAKKAMAHREERLKLRIDTLENYLRVNMINRNIEKISCPYFDIKLRKNPPSVDIYDDDLLPDEYKRTHIEVSPDKAKMLSEMKVGVVIPGAQLKQDLKLIIR